MPRRKALTEARTDTRTEARSGPRPRPPRVWKGRRAGLWLILCVALGLVLGAAVNPLTRAARDQAAGIAGASAAVYVTLRALNAVLSTAQEVEIGGALVVSGNVQPLKLLEPVDDTIERIAGLVFFVMLATGVLSVALGPVGGLGWALVALACLAALLPGRARRPVLARQLGIYGAVLALAVPLAFVLAGLAADRLTARVWAENSAIIEEITGQVEPGAETAAEPEGWFRLFPDDLEHYRAIAGNIMGRADELIASYLALLSVFIFKLAVLPALVLGGLWLVLRALLRPPGRA